MELNGKIKFIGTTQEVSASFKKRELVITTEEQFPQTILVEFTQDKCDVLNSYSVDQDVKVGINIRGREWVNPQGETKYFNSIQGWRIEKSGEAPIKNTSEKLTTSNTEFVPIGTEFKEEEHDDLPF